MPKPSTWPWQQRLLQEILDACSSTTQLRPPTIEADEKPVHRLSRPLQQQNKRKQHDGDCYRWGGKHAAARCKFKDYECHYCKKKGHLASVCRKKKQDRNNAKPAEQTNRVEEPRSSDDEVEHEYSLHRLSSGSSRPITVQVTLNGKTTEMEVDTGASVSIISEETLQTLCNDGVSIALQQSSAKLCTYTGQTIEIAGSADVDVEHKGQKARLPLFVTKGKGPSLLGRSWLAVLQLDWNRIFNIRPKYTLQDVLDVHTDVFQDKLGTVKGDTATIHVDPTATPSSYTSSLCITSKSGSRAGTITTTRRDRACPILRLGSTDCTGSQERWGRQNLWRLQGHCKQSSKSRQVSNSTYR